MSEKKLLEIPSNAVQDIRKIYNLDAPGRLEEAINILEKWIMQERHILKKDFKKEYLERALISSKGSIEKAKKRIDALCTMRTLMPHFFIINRTKSEFQELLRFASIIPLPKLTDDLYRIISVKFYKPNDEVFTQEQVYMLFQYCIILFEYCCEHDYNKGVVFVDDFVDLNLFDFVMKLNSVHFQQCMSILLKSYGTKTKGIHIITQSKAVSLFSNLIRQFTSAKIADRIRVYKNYEELFEKDLSKDSFPEEYGGKERSLNTLKDEWIETLFSQENIDYFNQMSAAGTDEALRSPEKFNTDYMGMPGSFRNLTVD